MGEFGSTGSAAARVGARPIGLLVARQFEVALMQIEGNAMRVDSGDSD